MLNRILVACMVLVVTTVASAQETASTPAAASVVSADKTGSTESSLEPADAASTDSALAAVASTESALAAPKTSEELLRKWADVYKSAKTFYEQSRFSMLVQGPREPQETNMRMTAAFARPERLKIDVSGEENITVLFDNGEATVLNTDLNQYVKPKQTFAAFAGGFQQLFSIAAAISDDPYSVAMDEVIKVEDLTTSQFEGKEVYTIVLQQESSVVLTLFFDMETFYLSGVKGEAPLPDGYSRVLITEVVEKALIDEMPRDGAGNEVDIFAFTLPEGAMELTVDQGAPEETLETPSSDTDPQPQ